MCMMSYKSVLIVIYKTLLSLMGIIMFYGCSSTIKKQYCYEMNNSIVVKPVVICTDKKQIERSTFKRIN